MTTPFARRVAMSLGSERFTLIDVGCAGGIEPAWRVFGDRLRALAFDASIGECQRLAAEEKNPDVHYIAGFADVAPDHPFAVQSRGQPLTSRQIWSRTSAGRVNVMRQERLAKASHAERIENNAWRLTELADPAKPVVIPQLLRERGIGDVDFLKIDVDGADFRVLNSFDGLFDELGIIAVRMEVNLFGGPGDTINTFNNTDRFLRRNDFDLAGFDSRNYAMHALPSPFAITIPAQTVTGRVFQGEGYYIRDLASEEQAERAAKAGPGKLLKLAAILSVWNQPDGAAEILLRFRDRLASRIDVDAALEDLAAQSQPGVDKPLSYREYMALFEQDAPAFYPQQAAPAPPPPPVTLGRRLREAWQSFRDPNRSGPNRTRS